MGEEIQSNRFTEADAQQFKSRLLEETALLKGWMEDKFDDKHFRAGYEIEACLLDENLQAYANNDAYLQKLNHDLVGYELAKFNVELNGTPCEFNGNVFSTLHTELTDTLKTCDEVAQSMGSKLITIGILPSLRNDQLTLANMSDQQRYRALNREVVRLRKGKPVVLDINGEEHLRITHRDVMLESAATSFQIHFQVPLSMAVAIYNASVLLSAPLVAISANSPYLFGKNLWDETRIPLFEMAVAAGGYNAAAYGPIRRVTFGSGYLRDSIFECFAENVAHYPVLLPVEFNEPPSSLHYVRFHNGTIWRWNRPLIGFEADGKPHVRIEHRVMPAGPSVIDEIANAALYYGAAYSIAMDAENADKTLSFDKARDNFYQAARFGLRANMKWCNEQTVQVKELLKQQILPMAYKGLDALGVSSMEAEKYLGIIEERLAKNMNGATWQRAFVKKNGADMEQLIAAYLEQQQSQLPVHDWPVSF